MAHGDLLPLQGIQLTSQATQHNEEVKLPWSPNGKRGNDSYV